MLPGPRWRSTSSGPGGSGSSKATASPGSSVQRGSPNPRRTLPSVRMARAAATTSPCAWRATTASSSALLRIDEASGMLGGLSETGEHVWTIGMSGRGERERPLEARQRGSGVQPECPLAGETAGSAAPVPPARPPAPSDRWLRPARARSRSGRRARRPGLRRRSGALDSIQAAAATWRAAREARGQLVVGDVAGEDVPERVLGLVLHRRVACRPHELLPRQLAQRGDDRLRIAIAHRRHGSGPEHLADHRRVGQQRLRVRLESVETGGDQRLHRVGERHLRPLLAAPSSGPSGRADPCPSAGGRTPRRRAGCPRHGRGSGRCSSAGSTVASSNAETRRAVSSSERRREVDRWSRCEA